MRDTTVRQVSFITIVFAAICIFVALFCIAVDNEEANALQLKLDESHTITSNPFIMSEVRFDKGLTKGVLTPVVIPNTWKFIGVANGEAMNCVSLWFQAPDNTIYMISGFITGNSLTDNRVDYDGVLILNKIMNKLSVGPVNYVQPNQYK